MGYPHPLPGAFRSPLFRTLLLTAHISPQFRAQGCQVGSLKSAMVGVFTHTNQGPAVLQGHSVLAGLLLYLLHIFFQHICVIDTLTQKALHHHHCSC